MSEKSVPTVSIANLAHFNDKEISLRGWLQNKREGKGILFLIVRDGSGFCQCVVTEDEIGETFQEIKGLGLESSITITGKVRKDDRQIGGFEIQATAVSVLQNAVDYPISKKAHGVEFLMDKRHLWLRSRKQWAIMRVRNTVIFAIHQFFQERGYVQMDAPIFTGNACEGTTDLFETDYFDQKAYLSQSGQLYGEAMAMAMGKIYTFGPTFRAEKSKTRRHLSEFWMIEPEMAFYTLEDTMDVIEEFIQFIVNQVLEKCQFELSELDRDLSSLKNVGKKFPRLSYDEAVAILKGEKEVNGQNTLDILASDLKAAEKRKQEVEKDIKDREAQLTAGGMKKGKIAFFERKVQELKLELKDLEEQLRNIPDWMESARNFEYGNDFGGSDETVITRLFDTPVMVYNWPKAIKAFYMKEDPERPDLVKGVDVLAPEGYGEIVGGGERETDLNTLVDSINKHELPMHEFEWYLDLRRYGSVPHSGFGLGLERMITWICKIHHLRETIPFPRLMGRLLP